MVPEETAGARQLSLAMPQIHARLLEHTDLGPYLILVRQGLMVLNVTLDLKQLSEDHLCPR
jgi:hypothetical protein